MVPDQHRDGAFAGLARNEILAALDLGTTNCRLLIARHVGSGFQVIDSFSRIVRLGEGLDATGLLGEAPMARTVEALKVCAGKLRQRRVDHGRLVATEACRRALNIGDFLARVFDATGLEIEIIDSEEEARLSLAGVAPLLDRSRPRALVFDIGGGSTEVSWVTVRPAGEYPVADVIDYISLPLGVVSLVERYPAGPGAYERMVADVVARLAPFEARWAIGAAVAGGDVQMVGSSGTVTTLAAIDLGLHRYDRSRVDGTAISRETVLDLCRDLGLATPAARAAMPCVGLGRADLMVPGCAILEAICSTWPVPVLAVGDRGVREGILTELVAQTLAPV
jgi:exopolyphosphatase/guanosine-5'-triphosphate,3'-diphosphate pyrophosphatase